MDYQTAQNHAKGFLRELGVPLHLSGYRALKEAIILGVQEYPRILPITKELYPSVAKVVKTTPSRVERAIRHAIEVAFDRLDPETIYELFGNSLNPNKGKPTNSECIATAVEWVILREGMENQ